MVETDLGLFFLSLTLDEGAAKISKWFGGVFFPPRDFLSVMIAIQLFAFFFRRERERERESAFLQDG